MQIPGVVLGMVDFGGLFRSFGVDWHLLVVQSLNFLFVAFLLHRFGFKRVINLMDERREKIESGLAYAEKMQREMAVFEHSRADMVAAAKAEAETIVRGARGDAKSLLEREKEESRKLADGMVADAEREIFRRREQMLKDAKAEIGSLVVDVAKGVLAAQMSDGDRDKYAASAERVLMAEKLR
jgi:F-type H+-transporting ATPase subunit b